MNLSAVVRLVGINENTLRAWERRYGVVKPARDEQGRRIYSDHEVHRIQLLWALVKEGHAIGLISQLEDSELQNLLKKSLSPQALATQRADSKVEKLLQSIIRSLEKFDLESLHQVLQRARFDLTIKEIVIDLIKPLMEKVGLLSESRELSITQEHLLSSLLRDYLGNIHQSLSPYDFKARRVSKSVCITTREGDLHEFNILLASILSNLYQFKTFYLGPNMPAQDLGESCHKLKPDFLILGFTYLPPEREIISPFDYLLHLDRALPRQVTFLCGGAYEDDLAGLSSDREIISLKGITHLDEFLASRSY